MSGSCGQGDKDACAVAPRGLTQKKLITRREKKPMVFFFSPSGGECSPFACIALKRGSRWCSSDEILGFGEREDGKGVAKGKGLCIEETQGSDRGEKGGVCLSGSCGSSARAKRCDVAVWQFACVQRSKKSPWTEHETWSAGVMVAACV